ncbi:MAG: cytochrome c biogenesis protein ResB [Spirochaetales bacterium]|nr:cytochrome c biogenesis protein ResB [Spirochaetales bacterium]
MKNMLRVAAALGSLRFGIILMALLGAIGAASAFFEGGRALWGEWYTLVLVGLFGINLVSCTLFSLAKKIRLLKSGEFSQAVFDNGAGLEERLEQAGFRRRKRPGNGGYASRWIKQGLGLWGATAAHLSVVLIIAGFTLSTTAGERISLRLITGRPVMVEPAGMSLRLESAQAVGNGKSGAIQTYRSSLSLNRHTPPDASHDEYQSGEERVSVAVNRPHKIDGWKIVLLDVGSAVKVRIQSSGRAGSLWLSAGEIIGVGSGRYIRYLGRNPENRGENFSDLQRNNRVVTWQKRGWLEFDNIRLRVLRQTQYASFVVKDSAGLVLSAAGGCFLLFALVLSFFFRPVSLTVRPEGSSGYRVCWFRWKEDHNPSPPFSRN